MILYLFVWVKTIDQPHEFHLDARPAFSGSKTFGACIIKQYIVNVIFSDKSF